MIKGTQAYVDWTWAGFPKLRRRGFTPSCPRWFSGSSRKAEGETISRLLVDFLIDALPGLATIIRVTSISDTLCGLFRCDSREATLTAIAIGHMSGLTDGFYLRAGTRLRSQTTTLVFTMGRNDGI